MLLCYRGGLFNIISWSLESATQVAKRCIQLMYNVWDCVCSVSCAGGCELVQSSQVGPGSIATAGELFHFFPICFGRDYLIAWLDLQRCTQRWSYVYIVEVRGQRLKPGLAWLACGPYVYAIVDFDAAQVGPILLRFNSVGLNIAWLQLSCRMQEHGFGPSCLRLTKQQEQGWMKLNMSTVLASARSTPEFWVHVELCVIQVVTKLMETDKKIEECGRHIMGLHHDRRNTQTEVLTQKRRCDKMEGLLDQAGRGTWCTLKKCAAM